MKVSELQRQYKYRDMYLEEVLEHISDYLPSIVFVGGKWGVTIIKGNNKITVENEDLRAAISETLSKLSIC